MRIAFLSWRDSTHPDGGGSEIYVEQVAEGLAARGHEVTIRCARHPGALAEETRAGVRFVRRGGRLGVYARGLIFLLSPLGRRTDVVVDVINAVPFAAPLVRRSGLVGLIHHVHRDQWRIIYPGWLGRAGWFVESRVVPWLYHRTPIVTVSEPSRRALINLGFPAAHLRVVHNGTPELPPPRQPRSSTPRLAVLSRVVPHKRIEQAVDVVKSLSADFPGITLDILGDGWWAPQLDEHIRRTGAQHLVHRHGWVDQQTKADLLAQARLLLVPSVQEGWCLAVMEAAALRTPAIAFASAGGVTQSILDGETGLLVEDLEEMVTQTRALLQNPERLTSMAEAARGRAASFSWAATSVAFERELEKVHSP